jgi:hypothetical protein
MESISVKMMSPEEIARYEDIDRRWKNREPVSREDFEWRMYNLTRYDVTITVTKTSPL